MSEARAAAGRGDVVRDPRGGPARRIPARLGSSGSYFLSFARPAHHRQPGRQVRTALQLCYFYLPLPFYHSRTVSQLKFSLGFCEDNSEESSAFHHVLDLSRRGQDCVAISRGLG